MENLTLDELRILQQWHMVYFEKGPIYSTSHFKMIEKVEQAIADKEFEEKTRPLNF